MKLFFRADVILLLVGISGPTSRLLVHDDVFWLIHVTMITWVLRRPSVDSWLPILFGPGGTPSHWYIWERFPVQFVLSGWATERWAVDFWFYLRLGDSQSLVYFGTFSVHFALSCWAIERWAVDLGFHFVTEDFQSLVYFENFEMFSCLLWGESSQVA